MGGEWLDMQPFEIFIAYISWATGGKSRPVLVMEYENNNIDTNKKIELPDSVISTKTPVGNLTETDKQRLLEFLEEK